MISFKSVVACVLLTGPFWVIPFSTSQAAASAGCNDINSQSPVVQSAIPEIVGATISGISLEAGEKLFAKLVNSTGQQLSWTLKLKKSLGPTYATETASLADGETKTLNITVANNETQTFENQISANNPININNLTLTWGCTAVANNQSEEAAEETTSKAVTSAVARSQTTVIQQNIGARVATVVGSAGAGSVDTGGGAGGVGGTGHSSAPTGNDDGSSFTQVSLSDQLRAHSNSEDDTRDVMRRLAMTSSFDSSVLAADMAREGALERTLALGPTDQAAVGGASGVDGRAALANTSPITVWGHGSYTSVDNDFNHGTTDSRYDGDVWGYNLGADYRFDNNVIAGLSLGYNDTNLTTTFNDGTYKETAWVASPYVIFSPLENLNIVTEAGYSQGDVDVTRNNYAVTGNTDSAMWYTSVKAIYAYRPMADTPLTLSPSVSLLAARKTIDSYTESDGTFVDSSRSNTRQFKPAIEAAYDFGVNSLIVTPFVEAGMVHDFTDELNNDKTAFNLGGGVRLSDSLTGFNATLEGSYLAGRSDYTEYTIAGTVSYGFELRNLAGQPVGFVTPFFGSDVDEYGNQAMTGGLGFDAGPMISRLSLAHAISKNNDTESKAQISMTLDF